MGQSHFREATRSEAQLYLFEFVSLNCCDSLLSVRQLTALFRHIETCPFLFKKRICACPQRTTLDAWLTGAVPQLWRHVPAVTMASSGAVRRRAPRELPALCVWDYRRANQGQQTLELQQGAGDTRRTTNTRFFLIRKVNINKKPSLLCVCAQVDRLWKDLCPLIRTALTNITVETYTDWGTCIATACVSRWHAYRCTPCNVVAP